jgi:dienelactone hydrolase
MPPEPQPIPENETQEAAIHRHCLAGNIWPGTPKGTITTLAGLDTYVAGDQKSELQILLIHDAGGWTWKNLRLLADEYSERLGGVGVWMPDFFHGEVLTLQHLLDGRFDKVDMPTFTTNNSKANRRHEIFACAAALRTHQNAAKVGAVGFCYGGWAVFQLGAQTLLADGTVKPALDLSEDEKATARPLVDAISTGHPSWLTKEEINQTRVPTQIIAPEHDMMLTPELKKYANEVIPTLGVEYQYRYFPGQVHTFCSRGSLEVEGERRACERAKRAVVEWFREILLVE